MNKTQIQSLYNQHLMKLVHKAHDIHIKKFQPQVLQASKLLSIKTGACPEDCAYCPQSAHYQTKIKKEKLLNLETVIQKAKEAKNEGATRFCMGAAWREVKEGSSFEKVLKMVKEVNKLDLEVCCTLGMLTLSQAKRLKSAGLYAYNHNLDSSPEFYSKIISTRSYQDRLETLNHVRKAGLTVCTGGIIGMGETHKDRVSFLHQLYLLKPAPESISLNSLVPIKGTPLENQKPLPALEFIKMIALCRILIPKSFIRLSAGRVHMTTTEQFLSFYSGANSIFIGEKLLTTTNSQIERDQNMLKELDLEFQKKSKIQKVSLNQTSI